MEARSPDPAAPAESNASEARGHPRRPRPRGRRMPLRAIGRKMALFAAANSALSLFLPWMVTARGGVNAFALGSESRWLAMFDATWVAHAVWAVLGASILVAILVLVDRVRSLGTFLGFVSLAAGGGMMFLAVMVFETVPPLRQLGLVACGVGGLVMVAGGALLFRARWHPPPAGAESILARPRELPWVTIALVALNALAFVTLAYRSDYERGIVRELGLIAASVRPHAFVTCLFLHADGFHLFANMAVLVAVGAAIERRTGRATFALVYLVSGLAGSAASILIDPRTYVPFIGSSGAVAGVMGLCLAAAPQAKVKVWFHAGVAAGAVRVRAAWLFSAWMALQAVGALYLSMGSAGPVGYWAHLGGVAAGLAAGLLLRAAGRSGFARAAPTGAAGRFGREETDRDAQDDSSGDPVHPVHPCLRRASRRERSAFEYLPHALVTVSVLVSVLAVGLTFRSGSLPRTLADLQRAWNSGDIDRVARFFPAESRERFTGRLKEILARLDPEAPEGRITYRVALLGARRRGDRCGVLFASAPPGTDPFRAERTGMISMTLVRDRGGWTVHAFSMRKMRPSEAEGP